AIKLAVNDYAREHLAEYAKCDADHLPGHLGMVAGATAGFCQVVATNPMEIVKIQMQLAGKASASAATAATASSSTTTAPKPAPPSTIQVVRTLGLRGLYRGTTATLARDVPFSFIFFPSVAIFKNILAYRVAGVKHGGEVPFWAVFTSGITAGAVAAAAVTPMDVVKTRLQVIPKPGDTVYRNMFHVYSDILKNEGVPALFKGVVPRVLIVSPLFAITVLVYEFQQRFLAKKS
ncbi:hypothetical protein HK102_005920, partial [Quaeritorhiza haematococci]